MDLTTVGNACGAIANVRADDQSENSEADRIDDSTEGAGAGGSSDQMIEVRSQRSVVSSRKSGCSRSFPLSPLPLALSLPVEAQQPKKIPRIGFLGFASASNYTARLQAFRQGLQELGYVEGKSIFIEYRYADGRHSRLSELASELVRLNVDVMVTHASANQAAKEATTTIPIVMALSGDAVGTGLVASLARPGGNVTGLTSISVELYGKRLELLKELIPKLSQVAVMFTESSSGATIAMKETQLVASSLGVRIQSFGVRSPNDFESAFDAAIKGGAGALIMLQGAITSSYRKQHIDLALKKRLPAIYNEREWVESGGLVAYGANYLDMYRRAATYVDKILKGAKPGDLPVEQASKFELVINLKTAKQIGLTVPQRVLTRADKVIK